ncbi:uncharacterized protein LOC133921911 [Phragmites australis]|uniref:uncharacterized protein LOC133921911 n=1 Tax=Phragmites australis TaxID=29695 RepID=UPI002D78B5A3|nr:uncharacterized protein LOC133921911 [Phragmites australis]
MLPSSRARSRSWGAAPWTAPPSPRLKYRHERSRSTTYSPLVSESHSGDGGSLMEEELRTAEMEGERRTTKMEEKARPQQEPMELQSDGNSAHDSSDASDERLQLLEREVAVAKQTEMKMLESLILQTKELEQAKIALEDAKLEVATLRRQGGAEPAPQQWSVIDLMFGGVDEEINGLKAKLQAAVLAEERSRKAADDLTAALSAVTMEAKQVKAWLSDAQAELEGANAEVERLRGLLHAAEAELWSTTEQVGTLTSEWKEAAVAWRAREKALLGRARVAEEEVGAARRENAELADAHQALSDENGGLHIALEQAVEEANAATESLELASGENAKLQDAVAEKERALETLRRENESLKASEAAARERAKELDGQLAATRKTGPVGKAAELPLEKWRSEVMQGKLSAAFLDSGRVMAGRKDRMFASLSNLAELKSAAAAAAMEDYDYEFDHFDAGQYGGTEHTLKHRRRRSILKKFGDLFRRRSLNKSNLGPPVLHH